MTTAHRPTFDPARGKANAQAAGSISHTRSLPSHTNLKYRSTRPSTDAEAMKKALLEGEGLKHAASKLVSELEEQDLETTDASGPTVELGVEEKAKIIEENKDDDDSGSDDDESESDDDSDDEDEDELLRIELERIKKERAEAKAREEERLAEEAEKAREEQVAFGNPLMNPTSIKRKWNEDVVFRNQTKQKKKEDSYVNDVIRSDFHRKFMNRYVR